jgi:hypothetical protein
MIVACTFVFRGSSLILSTVETRHVRLFRRPIEVRELKIVVGELKCGLLTGVRVGKPQ